MCWKLSNPKFHHPRERNNAIFPMNQLLLTLRFYAIDSHLISADDFSGVSKMSAQYCPSRNAIARLRARFIKFPTLADEIKTEQIKFFDIARFTRVVSCIDYTYVKIQSFDGNNAEYFRNRKGYFRLMSKQFVTNLEIMDLVTRW